MREIKNCVAMVGMALKGALPVRLSEDVDKELEKIARESGVSKSALIRLLVGTFVERVKQSGDMTLPTLWTEMLATADGRSAPRKSKSKSGGNVVGSISGSGHTVIQKKSKSKSKSTSKKKTKKE